MKKTYTISAFTNDHGQLWEQVYTGESWEEVAEAFTGEIKRGEVGQFDYAYIDEGEGENYAVYGTPKAIVWDDGSCEAY